jgi:hypothetical protein
MLAVTTVFSNRVLPPDPMGLKRGSAPLAVRDKIENTAS